MGTYKIEVSVKLVKCNDDEKEQDLTEQPDGSFVMKISEKDAISIDHCEKSVLHTAYPAIREAVSRHLTEISKKKSSRKRKLK
jgi:hypothetical protein